MKKKKYPKISPKFLRDHKEEPGGVLLDYDVYLFILEEIDGLEKKLEKLRKKNEILEKNHE